jgi:hypothetical protein
MTKQELNEVKTDLGKVREIRIKADGVKVWIKVTKSVALGIINSLKQNQRVWINTNFHNYVGYLIIS